MINTVLVRKKETDQKGKIISVLFTTVNNYLKQYFEKPRKVRKKKRRDFCKMILDKKIKPEQFLFTDESKV